MEVNNKLKYNDNIFVGNGLNRFLMVSSAATMATTALSGGIEFAQGAWNEDPNKFERAGYSAGTFAGEGAWLGATGLMAYDMARRKGGVEGLMMKNGKFFSELEAGGFKGKGTNVFNSGSLAAKNIRSNGKSGMMKNGKFLSAFSWKRDLGLLLALPLAVGVMASAGGGMVGRFLDEQVQSRRESSKLSYDNRFFDSRKYDANTYEQIGSAMQAYQDKMVSTARIFHGR